MARTMGSQSARSTPWPAPSSVSSLAPGISSASASPCSSGNIGSAVPWITSVGTAIEDSGWRGSSPSGQAVVLGGRDVAGALDVAADELTHRGLVEGARASGEHARVADQVVDDRRLVGPVHLRGRQEPPIRARSAGGSPRSPGVAGDVLMRTSERTRSGKSSASSCANAPPAETPTTCAAAIP